jgi:hypothetical protein
LDIDAALHAGVRVREMLVGDRGRFSAFHGDAIDDTLGSIASWCRG